MNKRRIAFLTVIVGVSSLSAEAQIIRESFDGPDYVAGATLSGRNGGTGFSGPWTEGASTTQFDNIQPGSLSYLSFAGSGNSVLSVPPWDYSSAPVRTAEVSGVAGTSVWIAYLVRKESDNTLVAPIAEDYFGLILNGTATAEALFIGDPGESATFALGTAGKPSTGAELSSVPVGLAQTALLVAKIDFRAGMDSVRLFVNPDLAAGEPTAPSATKNDLDLGNIVSIGFLSGYDAVYSYDEIRLGPSFQSVAGDDPALGISLAADGSVRVNFEGILETRSGIDSGTWGLAGTLSPLIIPKSDLKQVKFFRARKP
jgi:hypothetical protein